MTRARCSPRENARDGPRRALATAARRDLPRIFSPFYDFVLDRSQFIVHSFARVRSTTARVLTRAPFSLSPFSFRSTERGSKVRADHAHQEQQAAPAQVYGFLQDEDDLPIHRYPPAAVQAGGHEDNRGVQEARRGRLPPRGRRAQAGDHPGEGAVHPQERQRRGLQDLGIRPDARASLVVHPAGAAGATAPSPPVRGVRQQHTVRG